MYTAHELTSPTADTRELTVEVFTPMSSGHVMHSLHHVSARRIGATLDDKRWVFYGTEPRLVVGETEPDIGYANRPILGACTTPHILQAGLEMAAKTAPIAIERI